MSDSKFQPAIEKRAGDIGVDLTTSKPLEHRIMKLESGAKTEIRAFQFDDLRRPGPLSSSSLQANTDNTNRKNQRFSVDPVLAHKLSLEEERRLEMEAMVKMKVAELSEAVHKEADERGYQEGLKRGLAEARAEFQATADVLAGRVETFLAACDSAKQELYQANERFLIELIYRMGKMVLLKELATDKEYLKRLVSELIEKSGAVDTIRVMIHPKDVAAVEDLKDTLKQRFTTIRNLSFEITESVEEGGCIIDTNWSSIDASLSTQFESFHRALTDESSHAN